MTADSTSGIAALSPVRLSQFCLQREPPRPLHDRGPDYENLFDYDTLFYDVFQASETEIICLGPPLLNCESAIRGAVFRDASTGRMLAATYRPPRSHLQPNHQIKLRDDGGDTKRIVIEAFGRSVEIALQPSGRERLRGRRLLLTMSKDNPFAWICDWAAYNVRMHGADGLLIYDNGSQGNTLGDLYAALTDIDGLRALAVVPWPFPHGPLPGPLNVQDSFYCHPGMLEHARWRFCQDARSLLQTDIDELVVSRSGRTIFEDVERDGVVAVHFPGRWCEWVGTPEEARATRPAGFRHTDCLFGLRKQAIAHRLDQYTRMGRTKWAAVPSRCGDDLDWAIHDVRETTPRPAGKPTSKVISSNHCFRHFRQINTGWSSSRWKPRRYSPLRHVYDRKLAAALRAAFPESIVAARPKFLAAGLALLKSRWRGARRSAAAS